MLQAELLLLLPSIREQGTCREGRTSPVAHAHLSPKSQCPLRGKKSTDVLQHIFYLKTFEENSRGWEDRGIVGAEKREQCRKWAFV